MRKLDYLKIIEWLPVMPFFHTEFILFLSDPQPCVKQLDVLTERTNAHKCMKV